MAKFAFHPCGNFNETYERELTIFETDFGRLSMIGGLILLFGVVPFISDAYILYILNTIGIYAIAAVGLNLLIGYTGQISLGHGAFFGVGAYAAAILATKAGFPFIFAVPVAGFITALVGMIFGIPSIRLKHLYLTIATLASQFILEYVFVQWDSLTGGAEGISVATANIFWIDLGSDRNFFYVIFICFVVMTWMAVNLIRTRYGRAFIAIRDNDQAADADPSEQGQNISAQASRADDRHPGPGQAELFQKAKTVAVAKIPQGPDAVFQGQGIDLAKTGAHAGSKVCRIGFGKHAFFPARRINDGSGTGQNNCGVFIVFRHYSFPDLCDLCGNVDGPAKS